MRNRLNGLKCVSHQNCKVRGIKMRYLNRSAIMVFKTEIFLEWVKKNYPHWMHWDVSSINHHPNIYLFDTEDQNCWGDCFKEHFDQIFNHEIEDYIKGDVIRPKSVTFESHHNWLRFEYSELICDLSNQHLKVYDD